MWTARKFISCHESQANMNSLGSGAHCVVGVQRSYLLLLEVPNRCRSTLSSVVFSIDKEANPSADAEVKFCKISWGVELLICVQCIRCICGLSVLHEMYKLQNYKLDVILLRIARTLYYTRLGID